MVAQESDFVANYKTLSAPIKSSVDKFALLPAFLKVRGLVKQHIDSFNYFVNHDIHKILKANKRVECSHDPTYYLEYKKISIGMPSVVVDLTVENLTPNMCRLSDRTYAAPILVDVEYTKGNQANKIIEKRNNILIGRMPIMLRSSLCVLCGKDEAELAKLGECPLDPGGYFVVKGAEKVIVIQEQLSKNRIIIDNSKGRVTTSVTSSTDEIKSKTVLYMHHDKIYLQLNQFSKGIPILVIMKAMGIESDQEVVQMLGRDPQYGNLLLPSIQECSAIGIHSQQEALDYLDGMEQGKNSAICQAVEGWRDLRERTTEVEMEESGRSGKRRRDKKSKTNYEHEEDTKMGDQHEEMDEENANLMNNDRKDDVA